ncbi:hypothetical protein MRX96_003974 [Rhipicephalus microplus]
MRSRIVLTRRKPLLHGPDDEAQGGPVLRDGGATTRRSKRGKNNKNPAEKKEKGASYKERPDCAQLARDNSQRAASSHSPRLSGV